MMTGAMFLVALYANYGVHPFSDQGRKQISLTRSRLTQAKEDLL